MRALACFRPAHGTAPLAGACLLVLLFSGGSPRAAAQPTERIAVTGSWRVRVETWDWFKPTGDFDHNYTFVGSTLRAGLRQQTPRLDWQIEFLQPTLLGLPRNAVAPPPQGALGLGGSYFAANGAQNGTFFVKQAFARFKNDGGSLQVGRFTFSDGLEALPKDPTLLWLKRQRLMERLIGIGGVTFSHVQQSIDGVQWVRDTPALNVTLLAFRPTEGIVRLAGWNEIAITALYGAVTIPLRRSEERGDARLFVLDTRDERGIVPPDNRPAAAREAGRRKVHVTTVGGHYLRKGWAGGGEWDLLLWGGLQRGDWESLDHRAWAGSVEAGYQFPGGSWKPWLRLGRSRASGDDDPGDGIHRTFFPHFTARLYARFPFFTDLMNNQDTFAQAILRPSPRLDIRLDFHRLRLSEGADLWYSGAGAFDNSAFGYGGRPGGGSRNLADLLDISVGWRLSPGASATLYLAHAWGGEVIRSIYAGNRARFFYGEITRTF